MVRLINVLCILFIIISPMRSQVTIGAGIEPKKGILLDIKENNNTKENSTGAIRLPRIAIEDLSKFGLNTETSDFMQYEGTLVYNVADIPLKNISPGMYYWNSTKWIKVNENLSSLNINNGSGIVFNGLENTINLGGELSENAIVESNNGNSLVFSTNSDNGKLKVTSTTIGVTPKIELGAISDGINDLNENPELNIHSSASSSGKGGRVKFSNADSQYGIIIQHNTAEDKTNQVSEGLLFSILNGGISNPAMIIDQQKSNVGIGTTSPNAGAALDISSGPDKNKGLLLPKVSLNTPSDNVTISNPAKGLMVYNDNPDMYRGEGLYMNYGDPTTPNWMGFLNNQITSNSYNLGNVYVKSASNVIKLPVSAGTTNNNIDLGMEVTLELDPNSDNLIMLNYSMPLGLNNQSTQSPFPGGYIGIRVVDGSGDELEDASRKVGVYKPVNGFFMSTVSGSSLQTIKNPSQTNKLVVTYKLKGYVENAAGASMSTIFNRWDIPGNPNFNWGNASMYVIIYTRSQK